MPNFSVWPSWVGHLAWTVAIIGSAYAAGHVIRALMKTRLERLAARTRGDWDDVLITEVARRFPFWSVLVGVSVSLSEWPLTAEAHQRTALLVSVIGIVSVTFAAAAVAASLASTFGPRAAPAAPVSGLTETVARVVVIFLGFLVMVRSLGYDITPYLTALGIGGLAVALALQDPLSNFFAGLSMTFSGQLSIGDWVRLDSGTEGYVSDFDWRTTTIRTPVNTVIVPNSKLAQAIVTNYERPSPEVVVAVELNVRQVSDFATVERITLEAARAVMHDVPGGVKTFEPLVLIQRLTPSLISFSATMRAQHFSHGSMIRNEFLRRVQAGYLKEGILEASSHPGTDSPSTPAPSAAAPSTQHTHA